MNVSKSSSSSYTIQDREAYERNWNKAFPKKNKHMTENTAEKQRPAHFFKPGQSGNPNGRPKGSLNFKTKWEKFVSKIAAKDNLLPEDIDEKLMLVAYKKANDGDYQFYRDIHDRVYGKPLQTTDITTKGDKLTSTDSKLDLLAAELVENNKKSYEADEPTERISSE
jgi:hypothetical protein